MEVGDKVVILDDGKHHRVVEGEVSFIFDENTIAVNHTLWGYGQQLPMHQLYRRGCDGWSGVQTEYIDIQGNICKLPCEEWTSLVSKRESL